MVQSKKQKKKKAKIECLVSSNKYSSHGDHLKMFANFARHWNHLYSFLKKIPDALNLGYKSSQGEKNSKEIMLDDLPHSEFYKENENINSVH